MPTCFIVMPITTPSESQSVYGADSDHFKHVLDHLFIPAVVKANHEPIIPITAGAEVIHAEIIKHLQDADLVLCDISTLNPNVFFELGIRTATDRPVAIVKDLLTTEIPFDTTVINHHTYDHTLASFKIENEIQRLSDYLFQTVNKSNNRNTLWKYFGLAARERSTPKETALEQKIDYIMLQLDLMRQNAAEGALATPVPVGDQDRTVSRIIRGARKLASDYSARLTVKEITNDRIVFDLGDFVLPMDAIGDIKKLGRSHKISIQVKQRDLQF